MCRGIDDGREINIHLFAETEKTKQNKKKHLLQLCISKRVTGAQPPQT